MTNKISVGKIDRQTSVDIDKIIPRECSKTIKIFALKMKNIQNLHFVFQINVHFRNSPNF